MRVLVTGWAGFIGSVVVNELPASGHMVVFSSTCAVYGEPATLPRNANHLTAHTNQYGATKLVDAVAEVTGREIDVMPTRNHASRAEVAGV